MFNYRSLFVCATLAMMSGSIADAQSSKSFFIEAFDDASSVYLVGNLPYSLAEPPMTFSFRGKDTTIYFSPWDPAMLPSGSNTFRAGLIFGKQLNSHFILSAEIDFVRFNSSATNITPQEIIGDSAGVIRTFQRLHFASLTIYELSLCPSFRYVPFGSVFYVSGGIPVGVIVGGSTTNERKFIGNAGVGNNWPASDTLPKSFSTNHIDNSELEWTAMLGFGFMIPLSDDFSIDAGAQYRLAMTHLLHASDYVVSSTAWDWRLGLTYQLW